jgi:hypothetical protein
MYKNPLYRIKLIKGSHLLEDLLKMEINCDLCDFSTTRMYSLYRHKERVHGDSDQERRYISRRSAGPEISGFLAKHIHEEISNMKNHQITKGYIVNIIKDTLKGWGHDSFIFTIKNEVEEICLKGIKCLLKILQWVYTGLLSLSLKLLAEILDRLANDPKEVENEMELLFKSAH